MEQLISTEYVLLSEIGGFYMQRYPDRNEERRFSPVDEKGFRHFLMSLPKALNSMVTHRNGPGFDSFDIDHYLATDNNS